MYQSQYGFRLNHSTILALMELMEYFSRNVDDNKKTAGVFIHLKKVFDTINHSILLKKLSYYGVRGISLDWIASYLDNRTQYVVFNDTCSDEKTIACGILQNLYRVPSYFCL